MIYKPRTTVPSKDNKYYYSKDNIFYRSGYGMPNCTAYAWGRWFELLNEKPKLCIHQAELWYLEKDGYKRGNTPKVGAVACWRKGSEKTAKDGDGHVAIVEEIKANGTINTSNSAYNGTAFYMKELNPPYNFKDYVFQGFIYLPIEFEEPKPVTNKFNLTRLLKKGVSGNDVKELQKYLNANGWRDSLLRKLTVDGVFGKNTEVALKKMQKKRNLLVDGIVGKNTAHSIGWLYNGK